MHGRARRWGGSGAGFTDIPRAVSRPLRHNLVERVTQRRQIACDEGDLGGLDASVAVPLRFRKLDRHGLPQGVRETERGNPRPREPHFDLHEIGPRPAQRIEDKNGHAAASQSASVYFGGEGVESRVKHFITQAS